MLRAATARSIVAAGLHPSLGIHHKSRGDALRLADDLMEPFRPAVDLQVVALIAVGRTALDTPTKRTLAAVLHADYSTLDGVTPLSTVLARLAQSLAGVFLGERRAMAFPETAVPIQAEPPATIGEAA